MMTAQHDADMKIVSSAFGFYSLFKFESIKLDIKTFRFSRTIVFDFS